jgi:hypothetical protein
MLDPNYSVHRILLSTWLETSTTASSLSYEAIPQGALGETTILVGFYAAYSNASSAIKCSQSGRYVTACNGAKMPQPLLVGSHMKQFSIRV